MQCKGMQERLKLCILTPALWQKWCEHAKLHGYPEPVFPEKSIVVTRRDDVFVAAVGLHECDRTYILAEDLVFSADIGNVGLALRAEAATFMVDSIQNYAMIARKFIRATVSSRGASKFLQKRGFVLVSSGDPADVLDFRTIESNIVGAPIFESLKDVVHPEEKKATKKKTTKKKKKSPPKDGSKDGPL